MTRKLGLLKILQQWPLWDISEMQDYCLLASINAIAYPRYIYMTSMEVWGDELFLVTPLTTLFCRLGKRHYFVKSSRLGLEDVTNALKCVGCQHTSFLANSGWRKLNLTYLEAITWDRRSPWNLMLNIIQSINRTGSKSRNLDN